MKLKPEYAPAYLIRAADYYRLGQVDKALEDWNRATGLNSNQVEAYVGRTWHILGEKICQSGARMETATRLESKTARRDFDSLAWLQATSPDKRARNVPLRIEVATKACQLTQWNDWRYVDTLAAAYAESVTSPRLLIIKNWLCERRTVRLLVIENAKKRLNLYDQRRSRPRRPALTFYAFRGRRSTRSRAKQLDYIRRVLTLRSAHEYGCGCSVEHSISFFVYEWQGGVFAKPVFID